METEIKTCVVNDITGQKVLFIIVKDEKKAKFKILNSSLDKYILSAIDYDYEILNINGDIALRDLKPYFDKADILFVVNETTPLLSEFTIEDILVYFMAKNAKAVKLPIGFVFDTEYLKNNTNISFDSTYMRNEEDFTEVCDEKSRRKVEKIMQQRIIDFYREDGIVFESDNVYLEPSVDIGSGAIISSNVKLCGETAIGENSIIKENSVIIDSSIGENCSISNSYITSSKIGDSSIIMPYCYIQDSSVGNNVLVKSNKRLENSVIKNNKTIE